MVATAGSTLSSEVSDEERLTRVWSACVELSGISATVLLVWSGATFFLGPAERTGRESATLHFRGRFLSKYRCVLLK